MNAVVKASNLPATTPEQIAKMLAIFGNSTADMSDLTTGVVSGFPVISYRGKVWRIRKGGEEKNHLDANGDAVQSLELVFVKAHAKLSKIYYEEAYAEGESGPPRCWSANGETPDAGVDEPIHTNCAACPNNVWGSKINKDTGAKGRLCNDSRRMAVVMPADLAEKGEDATRYLLRIPPASLNLLKEYAEKTLKPKGIPYYAIVTRVGFDTTVAYPKLTFKPTRFLTEAEAQAIMKIQPSEDVKYMLNESSDVAAEAQAAPAQPELEIEGTPPSIVTAPAAPRQTAAAAEDFDLTPTPAPAAAPAPAPKRGRPAKAATAAPAAPVSAPPTPAPSPAAAPTAPDDFEGMLNSLLGV